MKKSLAIIVVLSLGLMIAGCATPSAEEPDPSPSEEVSAPPTALSPSPTILPRELVFDADGRVIEDENGHVDVSAAVANMDSFTLEEVIKLIPYADGALATAVDYTLGRKLVEDFDNVISKLAAAELPEDRVSAKMVSYGMGNEICWDLEAGILSEEECQILYAGHDGLTEREQNILRWVIAGYEQIPYAEVE